jgi:hypothetical protein
MVRSLTMAELRSFLSLIGGSSEARASDCHVAVESGLAA